MKNKSRKYIRILFVIGCISFVSILGVLLKPDGDVKSKISNNEKLEDLYDSQYFKENQIDVKNLVSLTDIFDSKEERLVYFYKDGCSYCVDTSPAIMSYISKIKDGMPNIKFFDMGSDKANQYWDDGSLNSDDNIDADKFKVIGTPTLLHIKKGEIKMFVGQEDIEYALKGV